MNEIIQPYTSTLVAVAVLVLLIVVQSFHTTFVNLLKREGSPGIPVEGSYADQHWRIYRAHQNSVENFSIFVAAVFAAVLLGASAGLITLLAWIHVAARVAYWVIYFKGIGAQKDGPRTIAFVVGFFSTAAIALVAVIAGLL